VGESLMPFSPLQTKSITMLPITKSAESVAVITLVSCHENSSPKNILKTVLQTNNCGQQFLLLVSYSCLMFYHISIIFLKQNLYHYISHGN
jgi:hypothetical protein